PGRYPSKRSIALLGLAERCLRNDRLGTVFVPSKQTLLAGFGRCRSRTGDSAAAHCAFEPPGVFAENTAIVRLGHNIMTSRNSRSPFFLLRLGFCALLCGRLTREGIVILFFRSR